MVGRVGVRACLEHWSGFLPLDDFGRGRLTRLLFAADRFDAAGGTDFGEFRRFLEEYEFRESSQAGAVRVMTIHQAKGLGFDVVLLPDLQTGSLDKTDIPLLARVNGGLMGLPRRDVARLDPHLRLVLEEYRAAAAYDSLCTLYVALTRAKKALYVISSFPGKSATSLTTAALIKQQLTGDPKATDGADTELDGIPATVLFQKGNEAWYEALAPQSETIDYREPPQWRPAVTPLRTRSLAPSAAGEQGVNAASILAGENEASLQLGIAVHALFEEVEWTENSDVKKVVDRCLRQNPFPPSLAGRAVEHFRRAMAGAEVRKALARPAGTVILWREKAFDVDLGGRWITGVFDRVVISGEPGPSRRAVILDYKTNQVETEEEIAAAAAHYRPQLSLYREALAALLDMPAVAITTRLVFTGPGRVVEVDCSGDE